MRGGGLSLVAIHCTVCVPLLCVHVVVEIFTSALFTIPFTSVHVYNVLVVQCISFRVSSCFFFHHYSTLKRFRVGNCVFLSGTEE